ncbi:hypothetical protein MUS1_04975 [Marinomonas ushuaiensis DSM 15871]|uniref:DUF306 domain-containing protein n=1 Tax=Marinomonas ushuaiensis DSM 15871 TaxID=1122207 RepID=X7E207_9GAMM|nr:META domain-containing protein [Marinomonas ushuaiensis]ETX09982.1 hypothetical protein MUS1_04975 [Marinomonas ushuaiensis DSM 15871]
MNKIMLVVSLGVLALSGCQPAQNRIQTAGNELVLDGVWQVEDIDLGGVIDSSMMTIEFDDQGRVSGSTGCNRYTAEIDVEGDTFLVSKAASTRRLCAPSLNLQEQRFLSALNDVTHYEFNGHNALIVLDAENSQRLKLVEMTLKED